MDGGKRRWTIPNLMSAFRLALAPVIAWLYCGAKNYPAAAAVLLLSGLTDVADGYVARRFHMVSDVGKVLDPVADKLTQGVAVVCLMLRFAALRWLFALLLVKELLNGILSLRVVRRTHKVYSARWHGKAATVLLYATILVHIVWPGIPTPVSAVLTAVSGGMAALSFALYARDNLRALRALREGKAPSI